MGKIARSFGTHDGSFHADEVTACALLLLFNLIDRDKIIRTRDLKKLSSCEYICDVGGVYNTQEKKFDHHQAEYTGSLSSAGMILSYLKEIRLISPHFYDFLNQSLIKGIDDHDNGRDPQIKGLCSFSLVVSNFAPIEYQVGDETLEIAFQEALNFVLGHLQRLSQRYNYIQSCKTVVKKVMESDTSCLFFDKGMPWMESFFELGGAHHPAAFVIMPSGNHWKLRGIPPSLEDRMNVRVPLPQEWAGLINHELKRVTGIPGAIFCHKGRFISVWETKEDALKALQIVLNLKEGKK